MSSFIEYLKSKFEDPVIIFQIFVVVIILSTMMYSIYLIQNRQNTNNTKYNDNSKKISGDSYNFNELKNMNYFKSGPNNQYDCKLKDFYIKTAYNCFCIGDFKNDYVDVNAIKYCNKYHLRALDMQIFSIDGNPVISANYDNSIYYKQLLNYITLNEGLNTITEVFLEQGNLNDDPLFLNLRINYGKKSSEDNTLSFKENMIAFYNKIHDNLINAIGPTRFFSLYQRKYNSNYDNDRNEIVPNIKFKYIKRKVFIFVTIVYGSSLEDSYVLESKLNDLVDLYSNDGGITQYRFDDLDDNTSSLSNIYTNNMSICLPQLFNDKSSNFDFVVPFSKGIQFVAMNFQTNDTYLKYYDSFFKNQIGSSSTENVYSPYIKKIDKMLNFDEVIINDYSSLLPNYTYKLGLLKDDNTGDISYCVDISYIYDASINFLKCNDTSDNFTNYNLFKFEPTENENYYYMKTFVDKKYCSISGENGIICDKVNTNGAEKFKFTQSGLDTYYIQNEDLSYCSGFSDSDGNNIYPDICCNIDAATANFSDDISINFQIERYQF
tara:strand:+ start:16164 stop:17810 length:1647 start_codon:yes stop_codon:yes gene_type:complete